ncbi:MAG TPA: glycosyltransferase [Candidatus Acetothermia bacterium]|nr:glycosyltransferase [Candidatus Acetothermia bacterium]
MRIAIISARLVSIDGVSVEAEKWRATFRRLGHEVVLCAGTFGGDPHGPYVRIPALDFAGPEVVKLPDILARPAPFDLDREEEVREQADRIKAALLSFIDRECIDLVDVENLISLPLNLAAGIALVEIIHETRIPFICRHHDFYWERAELARSRLRDYLDENFPPHDDETIHVVINRRAQRELRLRHGILSTRIPNVLDPAMVGTVDEFNADFRESFGIPKDALLFLQPSRIIERKCIEDSVRLAAGVRKRLKRPVWLLITGPPGNGREDDPYCQHILRLAGELSVPVVLGWRRIFIRRGRDEEGKIYSIADAYAHANFVTFPSRIEGFGNPVIEAAANHLPLLVRHYPVLDDMLDKGFKFVLLEDGLTRQAVDQAVSLLTDRAARRVLSENAALVQKYFAPLTLEILLSEVLERAEVAPLKPL